MPFLTQGKTNWKYILIVAILAIIVGGSVLYYYSKFPVIEFPPIPPSKLGKQPITPPKVEKKFFYALTQNVEKPSFQILKIDPESKEILKKIEIDGLATKIKYEKNIYVLSFKVPLREKPETFITIYDENLNKVASHPWVVTDFEAKDNYLYILGEKILEIVDFTDPASPKRISSLSFEKTGHDILFKNDKLYILDNIIRPLYLHIVDVKDPKEPKLYSYLTWGINAHLDTQDITDKWFVIESYAHQGGWGTELHIFPLTPPIEEISNIILQRYSWKEREKYIGKIKVIDNYLYALSLDITYDSKTYTSELLVYDLNDLKEAKKISSLTLEKDKNFDSLRERGKNPPLIREGALLYYGGSDGIYIIDASNPRNPLKKDFIKTDFRVISLDLNREG